jgi:hypothetical protein
LTADPGPGLAASPTGFARSCTRRAATTSSDGPGLAELLLANLLRTLVLPTAIAHWHLRSGEGGKERTKVVAPVAANLVFQMAAVAMPRELFRNILQRIAAFRPAAAARCDPWRFTKGMVSDSPSKG